MMGDFGVKASIPEKSVTNAPAADIAFTSKYPFHKLDSSKEYSFQNINVYFKSEPPVAARTQIYSFDHGYNYIPATWMMFSVPLNASLNSQASPAYGYANSAMRFGAAGAVGIITMEVDNKQVRLYSTSQDTTAGGIFPQLTIRDYTVVIRLYVFADEIPLTTSS